MYQDIDIETYREREKPIQGLTHLDIYWCNEQTIFLLERGHSLRQIIECDFIPYEYEFTERTRRLFKKYALKVLINLSITYERLRITEVKELFEFNDFQRAVLFKILLDAKEPIHITHLEANILMSYQIALRQIKNDFL